MFLCILNCGYILYISAENIIEFSGWIIKWILSALLYWEKG